MPTRSRTKKPASHQPKRQGAQPARQLEEHEASQPASDEAMSPRHHEAEPMRGSGGVRSKSNRPKRESYRG
jgi:hypothetical protein